MQSAPSLPTSRGSRLERAALWAFFGFTAVAVLGYATFGTHPALLARYPGAAWFYGISFRFFALAHVWMGWGVLALFLTLRTGARWLPAFGALYAISLASELMGTRWGIPFGEYAYSTLLAPMWLGSVPVAIPVSWFAMAIPSYALAMRAFPGAGRRVARVVFASVVLLAWDLSLDPAMSYATAYWTWAEAGPYYGMPLLNLFGWFVTGVLLMAALAALRADDWMRALPLRWLALFYLANLLMPLGMNVAAGLWGAVAATAVVLLAVARPVLRAAPAPPRAAARGRRTVEAA
jgi:uncharacterized membrane protein